jgi:hypothetical protein
MKKIWIVFALPIIAIGILMAYIFIPGAKTSIGDIFGSITPMIVTGFTNAGNFFLGLPYGLWMIGLIFFAMGIFVDRWAWHQLLSLRRGMVASSYRETGIPAFQSNVGLTQGAVAPAATQPTTSTVPLPVIKPEDA